MDWGVSNQTIQELEDKLFSAILIEQRQFNSIKKPVSEKIDFSKHCSAELSKTRGTELKNNPLFSGRGHGPYVELIDGSVKLDLIGGIGPYILGHSHPLQIRSFLKASRGCLLNSTNFIPSELSLQLSKSLLEFCHGSALTHCWFSGSGSMANDSAMRLLWHKRVPRTRILAFENSFAGRSLVMQSITQGDSSAKDLLIDYIPFPKDEDSTYRSLQILEQLIKEHGDSYITFYGELVQGEAGINLPLQGSLAKIFKAIKKQQIPIWIDEVQTFARTTQLFAFQKFNVEEFVDICTIGKAFNISAVLFSNQFSLKQGLGGTFQANIASILFAIDLLRLLKDGAFFEPKGRSHKLESSIAMMFKNITAADNKFNSRAHGVGLMWAISFKNGTQNFIEAFLKDLFENGIIAWRAGRQHHCLRLLFPYTLTNNHLKEIEDIFIQSFSKFNDSES
ncbi:MAG: hypothetical protein COW01_01235 [Bdellovibrionales bacterium CG12_big_fil_rev_8_21_14_0_65_38_15]|nr:MAG: hypothetical protein COW79_03385 [Bdellovibrionales bacterium CG22_combo_CG10-13_8_21_14_all_38_13]PIQ57256.1 MAG: hypothetical protein COW01_01235 [Bdellovibrionales bacterium CG12_big_fil_rev_8_21_14_0_65_38_15]PIR29662.1 MAG: hypothetical protein COV38_09530 [Bdellovibrionales bacterium CG11_big_fil_rev_8_21_14_0_20_38_13]